VENVIAAAVVGDMKMIGDSRAMHSSKRYRPPLHQLIQDSTDKVTLATLNNNISRLLLVKQVIILFLLQVILPSISILHLLKDIISLILQISTGSKQT